MRKDGRLVSVYMEKKAFDAVSAIQEHYMEKYGFKLTRTAVIERAVLEMYEEIA